MINTLKFSPGDVVWVPSTLSNHTKQELWPAKFLKQTNRQDICMVALYGSNPHQADEQFLVDTESIIAFDKHQVVNPEPDLLFAYQMALHDFNQKNLIKVEQTSINTSAELCQFIENLLLAQFLEPNLQVKETPIIDYQIPKLGGKDIPLEVQDLKLYFKRMTPQMIGYLLQCKPSRQPKLQSFLEQVKNKIIKQILTGLSNNLFDFET